MALASSGHFIGGLQPERQEHEYAATLRTKSSRQSLSDIWKNLKQPRNEVLSVYDKMNHDTKSVYSECSHNMIYEDAAEVRAGEEDESYRVDYETLQHERVQQASFGRTTGRTESFKLEQKQQETHFSMVEGSERSMISYLQNEPDLQQANQITMHPGFSSSKNSPLSQRAALAQVKGQQGLVDQAKPPRSDEQKSKAGKTPSNRSSVTTDSGQGTLTAGAADWKKKLGNMYSSINKNRVPIPCHDSTVTNTSLVLDLTAPVFSEDEKDAEEFSVGYPESITDDNIPERRAQRSPSRGSESSAYRNLSCVQLSESGNADDADDETAWRPSDAGYSAFKETRKAADLDPWVTSDSEEEEDEPAYESALTLGNAESSRCARILSVSDQESAKGHRQSLPGKKQVKATKEAEDDTYVMVSAAYTKLRMKAAKIRMVKEDEKSSGKSMAIGEHPKKA